MTKHRTSRRRRSQKGGLFGFFESPDPNAPPKQGWGSWFSGATTEASGALTNATNSVTQGASNVGSSIKSILDSDLDLTGPTEAPYVATVPTEAPYGPTEAPYGPTEAPTQSSVYNPLGGRRRRKMKGGKGGLGLTYYATPVSGLNVAKPTYWIPNQSMNGGSRRKSRKSRKSKKSRKSRKSKKTRRH
jgi:hypothetical protein